MSTERRYALLKHTHLASELGGGLMTLRSGSPTYRFVEEGVTANNSTSDITVDGEDIKFRLLSDDLSAAVDYIVVNRTLNNADAIQLIANVITMTGVLAIPDAIAAPGTIPSRALIYVDSADGDLKVKFADGVTKTLATDT